MSLDVVEEHRGITVGTLQEAGVWWQDDDAYAVRIPYHNYEGEWYTRKLLDPRLDAKGRPKVLSPKNAEHHMYNPLRLGPNAELVFLCEGEYDTLSVLDCGFPAIGSQGTNTFNATWGRLFGGSVNVIAFDGDAAGVQAAHTLRKYFRAQGADAFIMETDERYDLNDLHRQGVLCDFIEEFLVESEIVYE